MKDGVVGRAGFGFASSRVRTCLLASALAVLAGLALGTGRAASHEGCAGPGFAEDHIIVRMEEGATAESVELMKQINGEGGERESPPPVAFWVVGVPAGKTATEAVALYQTLEGVEYAELDRLAYPDAACTGTEASLEMAHAFNPNPVEVGGEIAYAVVVLNHGPARAADAAASATVPDGARVVSARFAAGARSGRCPLASAESIRCGFGELGVGEAAAVKLVLRPTRPGSLFVTSEPSASNSAAVFESSRSTVVEVPERCTVADTARTDVLRGTLGPDVLCGFDGDDRVRALDGDDTVYGAEGDDTVYSGDGDDTAYGGPGGDTVAGGSGRDLIYGRLGSDILRSRDGVEGNDEARGGRGGDTIAADPGDRTRR